MDIIRETIVKSITKKDLWPIKPIVSNFTDQYYSGLLLHSLKAEWMKIHIIIKKLP